MKLLMEKSTMDSIADAVRWLLGTGARYRPSQMAAAIRGGTYRMASSAGPAEHLHSGATATVELPALSSRAWTEGE